MRSSLPGCRPSLIGLMVRTTVLFTALLGASAAGREARAAETSLRLASDPDDPIGQEVEFQMGEGIATFSTSKAGEVITVVADPAGPGDIWTLEFEAAGGAPLAPGLYPEAGGIPAGPVGPGLHVGTDTRSCAMVRGTFDVRQIELDEFGNLTRLRAFFEQHCEGQAPALRGEICVNADVPLRIDAPRVARAHRGDEAVLFAFLQDELWRTGQLAALGTPPAASFTDFGDNTTMLSWLTTLDDVGRYPIQLSGMVANVTESVPALLEIQGDHRLIVSSEPGEPLAGGSALDANGNSGWFWATEDASGLEIEFADWFGDNWSVRMGGPGGVPLVEGFEGTTGDAGALLEIRHNGLAAVFGEGHLSVRELRHDGEGYLESVRAAFEHRPAGGGPALRGELSFNSRVTVSLRAPARLDFLAGETAAFIMTADDVRGGIPALSISGLPAGEAFVDHGDGTGEVNWDTPAGVSSQVDLVVLATAADGRLDRATVHVTVTRPNSAPMAEAGGPYNGTTGFPLVVSSAGSIDPDLDPLTFHWVFGDGQTSTDPNPTHAWSLAGNYQVRLTLTDGKELAADSALVTISDPVDETLKARAFLTGPNRDLKLFAQRPWFFVQMERTDRAFRLGEIDQRTLVMISSGTGSIDRVSEDARRTVMEADSDENGRREQAVAFPTEELKRLFDGIQRPTRVPVRLEGRLEDGRVVEAEVTLSVTPKPGPPVRTKSTGASVGLIVEQSAPGRLAIRLFDAAGRLVRQIVDADRPAGVHELDLTDGSGHLTAGLYFYRVSVDDQVSGGKLMIRY